MARESNNKIQNKSDNTTLNIIILLIIIAVDVIIVFNYAKLSINEPSVDIMTKLTKLSDVISTKEALKINFKDKILFDEFIRVQKNLIMVYGIGLMIFLGRLAKKNDFKGIEHGSARWATRKEMKRLNQPNGSFACADKVYLDPNDPENSNANELIIGGSGKGKSFRKIKADILQMVGSYIVTDPKGELYRDLAKVLKLFGYKIKVLNTDNPRFTDGYNPFKYIDNDNLESDVLVLVNVFMKNTSDPKQPGGDKFWDDAVKAILTAIFFYLMLTDKEEKCFERVFDLVRNVSVDEETGEIDPSKSELERIFNEIEEDDPYHPGFQAYQEFKLAAGKTAKSILISVAVRLNIWINKDVCTMTYEDELELEKIGTEKTIIFVITSDTDDTFNVLASMFYTQAFKVLFNEADFKHGGSLPEMVSIEMDEFANIGQIPNFEKRIATCRSRNIRIAPVIQSISQLKALYKDTWETIIDCCNTINFLGANGLETRKYISELLGKITIGIENRGVSKSSKSASHSENENKSGRSLMDASELGSLSNKRAIIFMSGMKPIFARKFKTEKHKLIKYVGSDPKFKKGSHNNTIIMDEYKEKVLVKGKAFDERRKKKVLAYRKQREQFSEDEIRNEFESYYNEAN